MIVRRYILPIISLSLFPSCLKYHYLVKSEFPQAEAADSHASAAVRAGRDFVRSVTAYDQFKTCASFDALLLTGTVRRSFDEQYAAKRGLHVADAGQHGDERSDWLVIYLLAELRDRADVQLQEPDSRWTMYLRLAGGKKVPVSCIEQETFEPEYTSMFGQHVTPFKAPYKVLFELPAGISLPQVSREQVALVFTSPENTVTVTWDPRVQPGEVYEDFYWL